MDPDQIHASRTGSRRYGCSCQLQVYTSTAPDNASFAAQWMGVCSTYGHENVRDRRAKRVFSLNSDVTFDDLKGHVGIAQDDRLPGAEALRANGDLLGGMKTDPVQLEVYREGYAIYDIGDHKAVLRIEECATARYQFARFSKWEKAYINDETMITSDELGVLPWYAALCIAGENKIEHNQLSNSIATCDQGDWETLPDFRDPESLYIRKETIQAHRALLTNKQKEVYDLYFEQGCSISETAGVLGVSYQAVDYCLKRIIRILRDYENQQRHL